MRNEKILLTLIYNLERCAKKTPNRELLRPLKKTELNSFFPSFILIICTLPGLGDKYQSVPDSLRDLSLQMFRSRTEEKSSAYAVTAYQYSGFNNYIYK